MTTELRPGVKQLQQLGADTHWKGGVLEHLGGMPTPQFRVVRKPPTSGAL